MTTININDYTRKPVVSDDDRLTWEVHFVDMEDRSFTFYVWTDATMTSDDVADNIFDMLDSERIQGLRLSRVAQAWSSATFCNLNDDDGEG